MKLFKGIILSTIIIFIGTFLPLIGWGFGSLSSFFENPIRLSLIFCIIIQGIIVGVITSTGQTENAINKGKQGRYNRMQHLVPVINRLITLSIFFFASFCDKQNFIVIDDLIPLRAFGLFLYVVGTLITAVAHHELGKFHSIEVTIQKDHMLIQNGLYKLIRNPIYAGIIFSSLGFGIVFRSIICMGLVVIIIGLFIWRIFAEEKVMEKEFGDDWIKYRNKTWRLVPFIY